MKVHVQVAKIRTYESNSSPLLVLSIQQTQMHYKQIKYATFFQ